MFAHSVAFLRLMSKHTALFLTILIGCQAFYNAGVVGYWLANRAYISSTLCENRDRPEMHCDGKCYLKKKLATSDMVPFDALEFPSLKKGIDLAEDILIFTLLELTLTGKPANNLPLVNCRYTSGHRPSVFHPPAAIC